jgi:REP element-mobilizing transposase RayT
MPRKLRLEYEGAIYHAINRGDRRERIFLDDRDCTVFMETLAEACEKTAWQVRAYCLMGNHFHLVIETPRANLSSGMQWLLGEWGIGQDNVRGRRQFELGMETRKAQEQNQAGDWKGLRRSWCILEAENFGRNCWRDWSGVEVNMKARPRCMNPRNSGPNGW